MSHRKGGIGPAVQRPEAQEGKKEPEFNLCSPLLCLKMQTGLTHAAAYKRHVCALKESPKIIWDCFTVVITGMSHL